LAGEAGEELRAKERVKSYVTYVFQDGLASILRSELRTGQDHYL
jgi:hypothetical protein